MVLALELELGPSYGGVGLGGRTGRRGGTWGVEVVAMTGAMMVVCWVTAGAGATEIGATATGATGLATVTPEARRVGGAGPGAVETA